MANYNNRGGNNRFGGRGERPAFGGNRPGKPSFAKKSWGDSRSGDRPVVLHKATCAECGKMCEVPFRPIGGKPVYCKECFDRKGGNIGGERGRDRFPKRDFDSRGPARPQFESNRGNDVVVKQLEAMNAKLERLIQAVETLAAGKSAKGKGEPQEIRAIAPKKSSKKKAVKK